MRVVTDMTAGNLAMVDLYILLWGGLLHDTPGLTFDEVSQMLPISEALTDRVLEPLKEALNAIFPESDITPDEPQGEDPSPDPLPRSTSESGTHSPVSTSASISRTSGR